MLGSFYHTKEINKEHPLKLFNVKLIPEEYLKNIGQVKDDYIFLDYAYLIPQLKSKPSSKPDIGLSITELIEYLESSKRFLLNKINEVKFQGLIINNNSIDKIIAEDQYEDLSIESLAAQLAEELKKKIGLILTFQELKLTLHVRLRRYT